METIYKKLRDAMTDIFIHWDNEENWEEGDTGLRDSDVMDMKNHILECRSEDDGMKERKRLLLYRYMPANFYNLRNLEKQQLHLSANGVMNDIYEGVPAGDIESLNSKDLGRLQNIAYMTCLSETANSTLMWSHYADSHKGICIEYDIERLREDANVLEHIFPVLYQEERRKSYDIAAIAEELKWLENDIANCGDHNFDEKVLSDILPLMLIKGKAWEYEREWRIVYTRLHMYDLDNADLYAGLIPFPCVSKIYLGYRAEKEVVETVKEIAKRLAETGYTVPVYKEMLSIDSYDVRFELIQQ